MAAKKKKASGTASTATRSTSAAAPATARPQAASRAKPKAPSGTSPRVPAGAKTNAASGANPRAPSAATRSPHVRTAPERTPPVRRGRSARPSAPVLTAERAEDRARAIITPAFVRRGAKGVTDDDVVQVVTRAAQIRKVFTERPLRRFKEDVQILLEMLRDYWSGTYRNAPWGTIAAVTFALLYALSPIDLIPDFVPGIGHADDALLVGVCLVMADRDVRAYRAWAARKG